MTLPHFPLSPRDQLVLSDLQRFRQLTASQVRRLHFATGTDRGQIVRTHRALARLTKWGLITRITRAVGGYGGGSGDYIYQPPHSRTRTPDAHTLDIAELYVRLIEAKRSGVISELIFDPEQWAYVQAGRIELKPDAFAEVDGFQFFIEVDRGSEWRPQLNQKMRRYTQAFNNWREDVFPQVLWVVPDEDRARLMRGVVKRQEEPALFAVIGFTDALDRLTRP